MTDRYEKIRRALAMGPTPGEWWVWDVDSEPYITALLPENEGRRWNDPTICRLYDDVTPPDSVTFDLWLKAMPNAPANGSFIAACDPDTIRALLEEREALLDALRQIAEWPDGGNLYGQEKIKRFAQHAIDAVMEGGEMYAELMNENVRIRAENVMLRKVVFALIAQADKDPFMSIGHFAEHGPASAALAEIRKFNNEQERHMVQQIATVMEGEK